VNNSAEHSALKRQILLDLGADPRWRLFGNQVGLAFDPKTGAHFPFGLVVGASDILAIVKPRGRWAVLEVKTGDGRPTKEQRAFLKMIATFGGFSRVVRSVAEAEAALCEACR
jgi:hypothetical protein